MGYYDSKGCWREPGEGYYDAKGVWREPGQAYYDSKGVWREPGQAYYDSKGVWREPNEGFYDASGVWREPQEGPRYWERENTLVVARLLPQKEQEQNLVAVIGGIIVLPVIILCIVVQSCVQWCAAHFAITYIVALFVNALICFIICHFRKKQAKFFYIMSFFGNFLIILSFEYIFLFSAVPILIFGKSSFSDYFNFFCLVGIALGVICVVMFFGFYHEMAIAELAVGIACFIFAIMTIRSDLGENGYALICNLYNNSILMKVVSIMLS